MLQVHLERLSHASTGRAKHECTSVAPSANIMVVEQNGGLN